MLSDPVLVVAGERREGVVLEMAAVPTVLEVARLLGVARQEIGSDQALRQLAKIGAKSAEGLEALCKVVRETENEALLRRGVVEILGDLGLKEEVVVRTLLGALDDGDDLVRFAAVSSFRKLGAGGDAVVTALVRRLREDSNLGVRLVAAEALGEFGSEARSATPSLKGALKDENPLIRKSVERAIRRIQGHP